MAFVGLTYTGPQSVFQYHDKEPNAFNDEVKRFCPEESLPPEIKTVAWTKQEVNLADLYPDNTPLRQLKKTAQARTRKTTNEFTSAELLRNSLNSHARGAHDPQNKWHAPITSSQTYGWSKKQPGADSGVPPDEKFYKSSSDEARYSEAMLKQGMI
eukprot:TRINITY_DN17892_c0_g1_i1.p1 TRINITY_DN17892_c0_g1~~TRINITY_DN17892_c0_g1_i1.p1  ORF type:complete len:156 (+),score=25.13 TRINITY_DN17892_c0_g1_i1:53-520(+)